MGCSNGWSRNTSHAQRREPWTPGGLRSVRTCPPLPPALDLSRAEARSRLGATLLRRSSVRSSRQTRGGSRGLPPAPTRAGHPRAGSREQRGAGSFDHTRTLRSGLARGESCPRAPSPSGCPGVGRSRRGRAGGSPESLRLAVGSGRPPQRGPPRVGRVGLRESVPLPGVASPPLSRAGEEADGSFKRCHENTCRVTGWRRWATPKRRLLIASAILASGGVVIALLVIPIPHTFSAQGITVGDATFLPCFSIHFPKGAIVTFHWTAPSSTNLGIYTCAPGSEQSVYQASGTSGSGTFTADGGQYAFGQGCLSACGPNSIVRGSYSGAVLSM